VLPSSCYTPMDALGVLLQVHNAILEDLVHPTEIVGKRIRYKLDGSKTMKVLLDPKDRTNVEYKLETYSGAFMAAALDRCHNCCRCHELRRVVGTKWRCRQYSTTSC
jgi:Ribosomal protein S7e